MVNYMKDVISLLELNERIMTGLDRFPALHVSLVLIDYFSSVEGYVLTLCILVDLTPAMELMVVTYSKYLNLQSRSYNGQSKTDKEDFI